MTLTKLHLPLLLIGPLLSTAAGGGVVYATLKAKADESSTRLDKLEPKVDQNTTSTAVIGQKVDDIWHALDRLETKFGTK